MKKKRNLFLITSMLSLLLISCGERAFSFNVAFKIEEELNEQTIEKISLKCLPGSVNPPSLAQVYLADGQNDKSLLSEYIKNAKFNYEQKLIVPGAGSNILSIKTETNTYNISNRDYTSKTKFPDLDFKLSYNYFVDYSDREINLYDEKVILTKNEFSNYHFIEKANSQIEYYDLTLDAYIETSNGYIFIEDANNFIFQNTRYEIVGNQNFSKLFKENNDETCIVTVQDEFKEVLARLKVSKNKVYKKYLLAMMCKDYNYNLDLSDARLADYSNFSEIEFKEDTTLLIL